MYGGREKLHILLQWEKTCILSEQQIQVFSCSSQTTHLLLGFNEIEVLL